jgi:DNA-binding NarL/FixJ family response regulator
MSENPNQTNGRTPIIVIIEDHHELRNRLHTWLAFMFSRYHVIDFESAEEALDIISGRPAALVLMDIGLPGMNGIEATRLIKQKEPSTNVIVTTQLPGTGHKEAAIKAGADVFIPKDQLFRDLIPVMEHLLFA